jgi:hypothetical protein
VKNIVLTLFLILGVIQTYSQRAYYGYPVNDTLKKGDIVIVNIPNFSLNGSFIRLGDFDKMLRLLEVNKDNKLRIEINLFMRGSSKSNNLFSKHLCKGLQEILEHKTTLKNYIIINNASKKPLFLGFKEGEDTYINSRIEIYVE